MSISIKYYEKLAKLIEFREGKPYWIERPYKANNVDITLVPSLWGTSCNTGPYKSQH